MKQNPNCPSCGKYPHDYYFSDPEHVTIREATPEELKDGYTYFYNRNKVEVKRYILCSPDDSTNWRGAFGMAHTADTKEEIVFWAERWASKNDGHFIRPAEFEGIVGRLD